MLRIAVCLFVLQVVLSEPPPKCRGPPPGVKHPGACCKAPPIFKEEDLKECGIETITDDEELFKRGPPDCSENICVLKKNNLMKGDTEVDEAAIGAFLEKWAEDNGDFKDAVEKAKEICLKADLPGPPEICHADKIMFCIHTSALLNCSKWDDSDNCNTLKEHIEECNPHIFPA